MDIHRALDRFEGVMSASWPMWFQQLQPGLEDAGIEDLKDAVSPYLLPAQVEALYRWRNGGDRGVFGGWRMRPLDELKQWYAFSVRELESPQTWLPIFDDQIVNIVTLDIPGRGPSDTSVWYGHTHGTEVHRLFDSIAALVDVVCDAAEADLLTEVNGIFGLRTAEPYGVSLDGPDWNSLRLRRCPNAYRYPDAPKGTCHQRLPSPEWPDDWLTPLGITDQTLALRGASHTIAELTQAAAAGPVRGTIRGHVVTGAGGDGWWNPVVRDHTGEIVVRCDTRLVPITIAKGDEGEFDILLETADVPQGSGDPNPQIAAFVERMIPALPTARALAVRPIGANL